MLFPSIDYFLDLGSPLSSSILTCLPFRLIWSSWRATAFKTPTVHYSVISDFKETPERYDIHTGIFQGKIKNFPGLRSSGRQQNNNERVDAPDLYDRGLRAGARRGGHHRAVPRRAAVAGARYTSAEEEARGGGFCCT